MSRIEFARGYDYLRLNGRRERVRSLFRVVAAKKSRRRQMPYVEIEIQTVNIVAEVGIIDKRREGRFGIVALDTGRKAAVTVGSAD